MPYNLVTVNPRRTIPRETPTPAQSGPGAPDLGYAAQRIFMHHHNM